ncbi:MAG: hypothetical protein R3291_00945 [Thermoplasmata archaeon]|nr:hypothetical protein [Thermoplasmata archaeon]
MTSHLTVQLVLSFVVGAIALVIAGVMFHKVYRGRKLHHLFWALGLLTWGITDLAQGWAILVGWTVPIYKVYYFSAITLAGFLGVGTVGLLFSKNRAYPAYVVYVVYTTLLFGIVVAFAAVDEILLALTPIVGGLAFPDGIRLFTLPINIPGGIAFIGGAAYSFYATRKPYALYITLGALIPAVGGTLARFALPGFLPFTDFFGIAFLAAGVYLSARPAPEAVSAASGSVS